MMWYGCRGVVDVGDLVVVDVCCGGGVDIVADVVMTYCVDYVDVDVVDVAGVVVGGDVGVGVVYVGIGVVIGGGGVGVGDDSNVGVDDDVVALGYGNMVVCSNVIVVC